MSSFAPMPYRSREVVSLLFRALFEWKLDTFSCFEKNCSRTRSSQAMPQYINKLSEVIDELYGVPARHLRTELVRVNSEGKVICQGRVEVFEIIGHPKASIAYAWGWNDETGEIIYDAVLQVPPIQTALDALNMAHQVREEMG